MLKAVVNRFGSVYSFSGSYRADMWTLNINRDNTSIVTPSHTIHTGIDASWELIIVTVLTADQMPV